MPRSLRVALTFMLLLACLPARASRAAMPPDSTMEKLFDASRDSALAPAAEAELRRIELQVSPSEVPLVRHLMTQALVTQHVPTATLIASADSTFAQRGDLSPNCGMFVALLADELTKRREGFVYADSLLWTRLQKARRESSRGDEGGWALALARLYNRFDHHDSTVALLAPMTDAFAEPRNLHWYLGAAYEESGRLDDAIEEFTRFGAVVLGDSAPPKRLAKVYEKRHGDRAGLDSMYAAARAEARRRFLFDSPRVDRPAPGWTLPALDGRARRDREFAGRTTVLKVWGTWCAPCIGSMPEFVRMSHDPRWKGVAFLTLADESGSRPGALGRVRQMVREHAWDIPVVVDSTGSVARSLGVRVYPTVVVIDRAGTLRFRDEAHPMLEEMLERQLTLLLGEERAARTKR